ncbi:hypothetical protein TYRP_016368 [Tyrophagus putrescentiae]|nr:hypothetical protein TYRP_016368 [Tyrophagus putrescentiae]
MSVNYHEGKGNDDSNGVQQALSRGGLPLLGLAHDNHLDVVLAGAAARPRAQLSTVRLDEGLPAGVGGVLRPEGHQVEVETAGQGAHYHRGEVLGAEEGGQQGPADERQCAEDDHEGDEEEPWRAVVKAGRRGAAQHQQTEDDVVLRLTVRLGGTAAVAHISLAVRLLALLQRPIGVHLVEDEDDDGQHGGDGRQQVDEPLQQADPVNLQKVAHGGDG